MFIFGRRFRNYGRAFAFLIALAHLSNSELQSYRTWANLALNNLLSFCCSNNLLSNYLVLCYLYIILSKISPGLCVAFVLLSGIWSHMHHHHHHHYRRFVTIIIIVVLMSSVAKCVRDSAVHLSNWQGWKYFGWKSGKYSVICGVWRSLSILF